ncbi:hypothetical protein GQ55_9G016500 [Panicum hallii var. hallii]|uniref:Uncharacterized protein n=1 Tax=Panicum hallii var. hallii TaxID=1504633 RepID=A0A2T7BYJ0_9POAL|nr:hypothetical protein GQ55_9G016500 [Panicum hallii var. hallii]
MAVDESFKRPGSIPFKWEVQPGIPKQEAPPAGDSGSTTAAPATPRLALPPAARVSALASSPASCRRSSTVSSAPLSPPETPPPRPSSQHRRSMSARFATSLVLPFTRRPRRERAAKDDVDYCLLYTERMISRKTV